ncbi:MAG: glycosyltransferase [Candidatus Curtissbacteria bacterium]|nr:glycosyltransferase [Candidatus Curtissbacteria bacterium]
MKRILVIGNAPLPEENTKSRPAAGLRTYQFLKSLSGKAGVVIDGKDNAFAARKNLPLEIKAVCIAMPECYEKDPGEKSVTHPDGYQLTVISKNDSSLLKKIQVIHDEFCPDAIVSVNTYPSYVASQLSSRAPLWADLNGWVMAEGQAQAHRIESNDYLPHYFKMERSILLRADKISVVSSGQQFATLGELAALGRLNKESFFHEFVDHIPNGTEVFEDEDLSKVEELKEPEFLKVIPDEAFVLAWIGGYNTWVDEVTLFKGAEEAMEKCEDLYFVSTGGGIEGLNNSTFAKFKSLVEGSTYKDRFIFLGWVETAEIPYVYRRADCGLNVDLKCVETLTGARNRINEMMKFGVPVITTLGSEISYEVERVGAGRAVKSGKHELLSEAIISMYNEWRGGDERESSGFLQYGENGRQYIEKECNYKKIMKPLLGWLENPRPAPDRGIEVNLSGGNLKAALTYMRKSGAKKFLQKLLQKIKNLLKL